MHPDDKLYFKNKFRIPSARHEGWDYASEGFYFITICTYNKKMLFGKIIGEDMHLSDIGKIVKKFWLEIPNHFANVDLDKFILMPNHLHGIIILRELTENVETRFIASQKSGAPNMCDESRRDKSRLYDGTAISTRRDESRRDKSRLYDEKGGITGNKNPMGKNNLGEIIRWFKGKITFENNKIYDKKINLWQPRFYDRIIRNDDELDRIRQYIFNNPAQWATDCNNPDNFENKSD